MTPVDRFIYLSTNRISKKAITEILSERLKNEDILELLDSVWTKFKERSKKIEKKETLGSTIMVKLALLTLIIYESLREKNIEKHDAITLTSQIVWIIYEYQTHKFWILTRLLSKKPIERVRLATQFFINCFPYKSPGYHMELLQSESNVVAFDVTKCPAAEFFKKHNLDDLCTESWCNQDYPLAKIWNVKLERDKTIAKGNGVCNFRFIGQ